MKRLPTLLLSASLLVSAAAANFVAPAALNLPALLPPPPAAGSPAARVELDQVFALQSARTPEQAARCVQIENETIWLFGSEVLGPWFTEANLPKTAAFFAQVREDFIAVNRAAKELYPRKRPPFADERIKPAVECKDTPSYPSGHGIQSSVWAALLGQIFPDQAANFVLRAATTRNFKVISGAHYPSDLAAGQAVGEAFGRALLENLAVQKTAAELGEEAAAIVSQRATSSPRQTDPRPPASPDRPHSTSASLNRPNGPGINSRQIGIQGLDARWSNYAEYLQEMIERIQAKWYGLLGDIRPVPPRSTHVSVSFRLKATGEVQIIKIEDYGSGKPGVLACQNAVTSLEPYRQWSPGMVTVLGQSQDLTFQFYYQ
jgi:acid phosphatase (class A)